MIQGFTNLLQSRKAVLTMIALGCMTAAVLSGKVSAEQFVTFMTITLPTYLGAQGLEDAAAKYNPVQSDQGHPHILDTPGKAPRFALERRLTPSPTLTPNLCTKTPQNGNSAI